MAKNEEIWAWIKFSEAVLRGEISWIKKCFELTAGIAEWTKERRSDFQVNNMHLPPFIYLLSNAENHQVFHIFPYNILFGVVSDKHHNCCQEHHRTVHQKDQFLDTHREMLCFCFSISNDNTNYMCSFFDTCINTWKGGFFFTFY